MHALLRRSGIYSTIGFGNTSNFNISNYSVNYHFLINAYKVELIGGSEKYMAVCRECYRKFSDDSIMDDCCHGNRISSPPSLQFQKPKKSPLKINYILANNSAEACKTLSFEKENSDPKTLNPTQ